MRRGRRRKDKYQLPRGRHPAPMSEDLQGRLGTLNRTTARALKDPQCPHKHWRWVFSWSRLYGAFLFQLTAIHPREPQSISLDAAQSEQRCLARARGIMGVLEYSFSLFCISRIHRGCKISAYSVNIQPARFTTQVTEH